MKNKTIIIKCNETEYNLIKELAKLTNQTVSTTIRRTTIEAYLNLLNKKGGENM